MGRVTQYKFWYDPTHGVAGVVLMQFLPCRDPKALEIFLDFERAVYASVL